MPNTMLEQPILDALGDVPTGLVETTIIGILKRKTKHRWVDIERFTYTTLYRMVEDKQLVRTGQLYRLPKWGK